MHSTISRTLFYRSTVPTSLVMPGRASRVLAAFVVVTSCFVFVLGSFAQAAAPTGYVQTFGDEFNTALNMDSACGWQGATGTWATYWCGWNTRRLYNNSDDGVKMHDGWKGIDAPSSAKTIQQVLTEAGWPPPSLHDASNGTLKLRTYPIPAAYHAQFDWYGAKPPSAASMISTERSHSQMYGYCEVRAKLNSTPKNNHFSLWLLPVDGVWPPEIDMLETLIDGSNQSAGILSSANSHGESPDVPITFFSPQGGMLGVWHTYGFLWTATEMKWYVDGQVVRSHPNYVNKPMYFLGTWEVGGSWAGEVSTATPWPQEMEFDYARVYKQGTSTPTCALTHPSASAPASGFGASWNLFSTAKELLLAATCNGTSMDVSAGNTTAAPYIYKTGYRWTGTDWAAYALTGSTPAGDWFQNTATASIPRASGSTFFVGYTCQYINSAWKCGCSDAACTTPKWQPQGCNKTMCQRAPQKDPVVRIISDARYRRVSDIFAGQALSHTHRVAHSPPVMRTDERQWCG